jgi:hypothetical protein
MKYVFQIIALSLLCSGLLLPFSALGQEIKTYEPCDPLNIDVSVSSEESGFSRKRIDFILKSARKLTYKYTIGKPANTTGFVVMLDYPVKYDDDNPNKIPYDEFYSGSNTLTIVLKPGHHYLQVDAPAKTSPQMGGYSSGSLMDAEPLPDKPLVFDVTGGGTNPKGDRTLPVGLSGSEVGVTHYTGTGRQ